MDKKNTMLLTVIAVATLLVAVVGATFAYFAIGATATNNAKTTITGSTENANVGTVTLTGNETLKMELTAADMALANQNHTFYANSDGKATIDTEQELDVGTANLTGGDTGIKYECKAVYKVTYDDTDQSPENQVNNGDITWKDGTGDAEDDDKAVLKLFGADTNVTVATKTDGAESGQDNYTGDYTTDGFKLMDLKTAGEAGKTVHVTFKLTGGSVTEVKLQASLAIANSKKEQQDRLANKQFRINLETESFKCDTVAS